LEEGCKISGILGWCLISRSEFLWWATWNLDGLRWYYGISSEYIPELEFGSGVAIKALFVLVKKVRHRLVIIIVIGSLATPAQAIIIKNERYPTASLLSTNSITVLH